MSKLIIKYVRIVDNTSLESYLVQGDVYGVIEETTGDLFHYYRLDVNTPYQEGLWVNKSRCSDVDVIPTTQKQKKSLEEAFDESVTDDERMGYYATTLLSCLPKCLEVDTDKYIVNLPCVKPTVENIIEIPFPSDTSHGIDLYRVQYISPLDKGCYELTMGWMEKVKLTEEIYPRAKMMAQWKAVRNK